MATDPFPNIDEFGRGSCTCNGTMTGCAVCSAANVLVRFGKSIPRLSDGTPDMRTLGATMGARHRRNDGRVRHGLSLYGQCTGGTNWCTYCAHLQFLAQGLPSRHQYLSWAQIEAKARYKRPIILPGLYGKFPIVSTASYSSSSPARGRSDRGFTGAHMVTLWQVNSYYASGQIRDFVVGDADFGSPSRPVVPPHSIIGRSALRAYWEAFSWSVCWVDKVPASTAPRVEPWWGSDVYPDIRAAYTASAVAAKLRTLGVANYGKAINVADLEAGLKARGILYGTKVNLIDVRALMKPGTGR